MNTVLLLIMAVGIVYTTIKNKRLDKKIKTLSEQVDLVEHQMRLQ